MNVNVCNSHGITILNVEEIFVGHVDIVLRPKTVVCVLIIKHLKVIYASNNNIDKRNGFTMK